ncbi:MAG: T9SS type A sorting domain-containing protein [Chitinophagales bacterium]|nr:T9SS type A sorting domain-containing protein [Chitinophagales bacterium]
MRVLILSAILLSICGICQAQFFSGSYTGNGSSQSITAPGFQPDIVIIKRGATSGTGQTAVVRTATMSTTIDMSSATSATDRITGFTSSGFTIGASANVNTSSDVYHYVAIKAVSGEIELGTYTGNGTDNRNITGVSFQPDFVWVLSPGQQCVWRTSSMTGDNSITFNSFSQTANWIQAINSNGFQVGDDAKVNASSTGYNYVAVKSVSGKFAVGSYTGDGNDNRSITGFGLTPGFVVVKRGDGATTGAMKSTSTGTTTDITLIPNATNSVTDAIQQLLTNGIEIGTTSRVNTSSGTYYWFAFGEISTNIWNGTAWSGGTPTSSSDVEIASSTTPGSFTCRDITINSGISLTLGSGVTANIYGDVTNDGNGISGAGNLTFSKTGTAGISGNAITVKGTVTVSSGCTLSTGGLLTIGSDASNTGSIAGPSAGGYLSGNVTMQRYIPGKRAFRFLGHPFSTSQALTTLTDDIDITGSSGATNGFTTTTTNNPSAFWFDVSAADNSTSGNNPGWTPFTNTNGVSANSWDQYELMRILVRGAIGEGLAGGTYSPSAVTLDMTGVVNQGTQVVTLTKGSGSNFVSCGNPFPGPVDMQNVAKGANIGANYYVWDATSGVAGAYVTNPFTLSYNLPAFAALFTTATANSSNTLTFEEADKVTSGASLFKKTAPGNWVELLISDSTIQWDRLLINLDNNAMDVQDNLDGEKLYNPGLDFFTLSKDEVRLAVDVRPYNDGAAIPLGLTAYNRYNRYVITTGMFDIPAGTKLFLHDKYLNVKQELKTGFAYWFDVTSDTASQGNNRFEINMVGKAAGLTTTGNIDPDILIIPNPADKDVKISFKKSGSKAQLKLLSITGQVLMTKEMTGNTGSIILPLLNIPAGVYFIQVQSNNTQFTEKLIKQ